MLLIATIVTQRYVNFFNLNLQYLFANNENCKRMREFYSGLLAS